jgi:hypothetical protein
LLLKRGDDVLAPWDSQPVDLSSVNGRTAYYRYAENLTGIVQSLATTLLVATVLAVYRPRGMTLHGLRKQHEQHALSQP